MGRQAERVYTDPATIARFNALVAHLQNGARVRLHLVDGSTCDGVVAARPTVQQFYDGHGDEGTNGVVHLEQSGTTETGTALVRQSKGRGFYPDYEVGRCYNLIM